MESLGNGLSVLGLINSEFNSSPIYLSTNDKNDLYFPFFGYDSMFPIFLATSLMLFINYFSPF